MAGYFDPLPQNPLEGLDLDALRQWLRSQRLVRSDGSIITDTMEFEDDVHLSFGDDADATFYYDTAAAGPPDAFYIDITGPGTIWTTGGAGTLTVGARTNVATSEASLVFDPTADEIAVNANSIEVSKFTTLGLKGIEVASDNDMANSRTFTNTGYLDLDALTGGAGAIDAISASVVTGTRALVMFNAIVNNTAGFSIVSYRVSGATTIASNDFYSAQSALTTNHTVSRSRVQGALTPGTNDFEVQARVSAGTGSILGVELIVIPLY